MGLFSDYTAVLSSKKWGEVQNWNAKRAVAHTCKSLKSAALRSRVDNVLGLVIRSVKMDWIKFYKYVVKNAVTSEEFVPAKHTP